ncbi:MAG: hypothetical protein JNK11_04095 [Alphaproteobacteria bacterium]|nr:hypothetical protein [Alphaproteobacteria bacterium]
MTAITIFIGSLRSPLHASTGWAESPWGPMVRLFQYFKAYANAFGLGSARQKQISMVNQRPKTRGEQPLMPKNQAAAIT